MVMVIDHLSIDTLFRVDFIVVLSRLCLLQVVHVADPGGVVPDMIGI